jgi:hypothetical protein
MKCGAPTPQPGRPEKATGNNGIVWPTLCQDTTEAVFFGIGDWGGMCGWDGAKCEKDTPNPVCEYAYGDAALPGFPCPFVAHGSPRKKEIEGYVQKRISDRMAERNEDLTKANTPPQFVLNVGDNFYPGGIDVHCGKADIEEHTKNQFDMVWKQVYPGELTERMEWWGVLGNHDYGGMCYTKGWDQQILYTYTQKNWVIPAQYWMRSVQYRNMKIDIFFVDGSWSDTKDGGGGATADHNICRGAGLHCELEHYPGSGDQCGVTGPSSANDCENWFKSMWRAEYTWLMNKVHDSDADWQIVVTHYPGSTALGHAGHDQVDWMTWGPAHGIDLIITGHKHYQQVFKGVIPGNQSVSGQTEFWDKGTVSVVTGGGGGITTDARTGPENNGQDDAYGFMEFHATLEEITITAYSHGGLEGKKVVRSSTIVKPVAKKPDDEIIKAGLDPLNLLKRRQITV